MQKTEIINIQIHPRAFAAFGEDLVTNDLVAITELVKNSYDAYALKVYIKFFKDENGELAISIKDDGLGMTKETIINAWATIATPFKKKHPIVKRKIDGITRVRIVSGNKGVGRFAAAKLGDEMTMITKAKSDSCLKAFFDWNSFENVEALADCNMILEQTNTTCFENTGTEIVIKKLKGKWDDKRIDDLANELSRLISPFENVNDFEIIIFNENSKHETIQVKPKSFINNPTYKIFGQVSADGSINYTYKNNNGKKEREDNATVEWSFENYKDAKDLHIVDKQSGEKRLPEYTCGEFSFELRAWDLDTDSVAEVAERFNLGKREIRENIRLYKGISVYRDNVLVLPKSEATRDWLGLDAKRISKVGERLSTGQIVGIVNVSNEKNPNIKDTTDREKLVDTKEYRQFVEVLMMVVAVLQQERTKDKAENKKQESLTDIIKPLSAKPLVDKIEEAVEAGQTSAEILEFVKDYHEKNEKQITELNERLVYYAQTASLGSVAIVIMHEFLTGMTCVKRFLNRIKNYIDETDSRTKEYFIDSEISHKRMSEVAESFAPLYNRNLKRINYKTNLLEAVNKSIRLIKAKKMCQNIDFKIEMKSDIFVPINESELQTVLINILDNSAYWMQKSKEKIIFISVEDIEDNRVKLAISDTGCGISKENAEKVFVPGVTSKPKGIGMGLVIVTEIIHNYEGKVGLRIPGDLEGTTVVFDLPMLKG